MRANLCIETGLRNGNTYLKNAYYTTPFKVADITEDKREGTLHLMLMSSSPGILDGDEYSLEIEVAEGCRLRLHTQSFQRLFDMQKGASQSLKVSMNRNSSFCHIPHPTVPHRSSIFVSKSKIFISKGCKLFWGEVLTCGRKLSGEKFLFSKYHNITEIFLEGRLVVKENLLIEPSQVDVRAIGQLEGYTHQASVIYIDEKKNIGAAVDEVREWLATTEGISFGVSVLQVNGLVVRCLGDNADQLYNLLKKLEDLLQSQRQGTDHAITKVKETTYAG